MNKNTTERLWAAAIAMLIGLTLTLALGGCASMPQPSYANPNTDCTDPDGCGWGEAALVTTGVVIATWGIVYIIAKTTDDEEEKKR